MPGGLVGRCVGEDGGVDCIEQGMSLVLSAGQGGGLWRQGKCPLSPLH